MDYQDQRCELCMSGDPLQSNQIKKEKSCTANIYTVKKQLLDVKVKSVLEPSSPYDQSLIILILSLLLGKKQLCEMLVLSQGYPLALH